MIRQVNLKVLFICFAVITITLGQTQWTARTSGTLADLRSIVWTGEKLVSVGDSGVILTSEDGAIWESCSSGVKKNLASITWTGEKLVVVGDSGSVVTSEDGVVWTKQQPPRSADMFYVTWIDSQIISLIMAPNGPSDTILIGSKDAVTWQLLNLTAEHGGWCFSICWSGKQYATCGGGAILTSDNGESWILRVSISETYLYSITWIPDKFVCVGNAGWGSSALVYTSQDGITWKENSQIGATTLYYVNWLNNHVISVGLSGSVLTSPDAETWTPQTSVTTRNLRCVTFTGTQYVAVGDSGTIITSPADDVPVTHFSLNPDLPELTIKSTANLLILELPVSMRGSSVYIYSLAGKKVLTLPVTGDSGRIMVNTRVLASGVYQLVIEGWGAKLSKAFVVGR